MNNYHIYDEQAKGKYSVVFKARKKKRLDFVAIKRLQKNRKAKLFNQAAILSTLNHPNILKFHDCMETKNHVWAVTEYCPGRDLHRLIQEDKALPQHTVRGFVLDILNGLQYCHSQEIVICDLKPAAILLNEYGKIKLADFGIAQKLSDLIADSSKKKKGTPCYMAPQLFEVSGVYSFQSDIWSVGCIMYQLGQGNPPFVSTNFQEIAKLAKQSPTPIIQNFSSDFNNLLEKLLKKDPAERISWDQICQQSWIKGQLSHISFPQQIHFEEYKKNRSVLKMEKLRVSHNFEDYGSTEKADDRRKQFLFESDNKDMDSSSQEQMNQANHGHQNKSDILEDYITEDSNFQLDQRFKKKKTQKSKADNRGVVLDAKLIKTKMDCESNLQDSASLNLLMDTLTKKPSISLEQAISHPSDTAVKPIIGNKDIELIESFSFNKKNLGFTYIEPDLLAEGILNGEMDSDLKSILAGMKGDEKENVLGYFESLVQNSEIANYLFRSTFISYYMGLIKWYKQSSLRAKICEILGFLIRHATAIESDILKYGIISGFTQAVTKDKSEKVRRKAMAALGELLFYGATQVDEDAMEWDIPISLINTLQKVLKNTQEDEILRIYCCKSIENITAQAQKVGLNFSQLDMLQTMVFCFGSTQNEGFRTSIMCCVHHMVVLNPALLEFFFERMSWESLAQTLQASDTVAKTSQIIIWLLLQQLNKSLKSKLSKQLLDDRRLARALLGLLETGGSVLKGRVYLFIYMMIKADLRKVAVLTEGKVFQAIERHVKDSNKYQSQALQFLVSWLHQNLRSILTLVVEQARNPGDRSKSDIMTVVGLMKGCRVFDEAFGQLRTVQTLLDLLDLLEAPTGPFLEQFKGQCFLVLERVLGDYTITERLQEQYCSTVLPLLLQKVLAQGQPDVRFACMQYLTSLLRFLLAEDSIYDSTVLPQTASKAANLIRVQLIPRLDSLLADGPAPIIFKLFSSLFDVSTSFVDQYCRIGKISNLLAHLSPASGSHLLKAISFVSSSNALLSLEGSQLVCLVITGIKILQSCLQAGHQTLVEYPLNILSNLGQLAKRNQTHHVFHIFNQDVVDQIFAIGVGLQSHSDLVIKAKSEQLLRVLLQCGLYSDMALGDWKMLSKKGVQNYELFMKLSGLKSLAKPSELKQEGLLVTNRKEISRYN